ncbi:MAG TPA: Fe-S cluster assembly protein SufD [Gemmatimonadales bacterium]|nr:Fe-S cluster assembly protein SufD [Gemmatimonadales bacterium]
MSATFLKEFENFAGVATAESPDWLERIRRAAMERFAQTGFPSAREEEWRFTPITPIVQGNWRPASGAEEEISWEQLAPFVFGHPEWCRLVFVNGEHAPSLSFAGNLPLGVVASSLSDALRNGGDLLQQHLARYASVEESPFTALNTALFRDGGFVAVPPGLDVPLPINLVFVTTSDADGTAIHPRNLILVDRNARASVVESYVTLGPYAKYWTNPVTEVWTGANSWVEHTRIQRESEAAFHVGTTQAEVSRDSHYRSFSMAMGAALARHSLNARLADQYSEALLYGLYITRGEQLVDNHTVLYHDHPNCHSWEVYKGILDGRSRAVFNGKVMVKPEAQKTDAKQTNRNLVLSDFAKVDTKPQLEIFADDVKCTHGATVGQLDEVALFYARSRGVTADEARRLLTYAFAAEVIAEVALDPVREELERLVRERLGTL